MKHIFAYSLLLSPIILLSAEKPTDRVPQIFITPENQTITNSLPCAIVITASSAKEKQNIIIAHGESTTIPIPAEISIAPAPENKQATSTSTRTQPKRRKSYSEEEPCIQQ